MPASDEMHDAFGSGFGSPSVDCACGRRHCAPDSLFIDDSERQEMLDRHQREPDKTIVEPGMDAISGCVIGGRTVVRDCPCGWFDKFEELIWAERERILRYYNQRRAAEAKLAKEMDALLANANESEGKQS